MSYSVLMRAVWKTVGLPLHPGVARHPEAVAATMFAICRRQFLGKMLEAEQL